MPKAGWYDDKASDGVGRQRFWDGDAWTDLTRPKQQRVAPDQPAVPAPSTAASRRPGRGRTAMVAAVAAALAAAGTAAALTLLDSGQEPAVAVDTPSESTSPPAAARTSDECGELVDGFLTTFGGWVGQIDADPDVAISNVDSWGADAERFGRDLIVDCGGPSGASGPLGRLLTQLDSSSGKHSGDANDFIGGMLSSLCETLSEGGDAYSKGVRAPEGALERHCTQNVTQVGFGPDDVPSSWDGPFELNKIPSIDDSDCAALDRGQLLSVYEHAQAWTWESDQDAVLASFAVLGARTSDRAAFEVAEEIGACTNHSVQDGPLVNEYSFEPLVLDGVGDAAGFRAVERMDSSYSATQLEQVTAVVQVGDLQVVLLYFRGWFEDVPPELSAREQFEFDRMLQVLVDRVS